MLSLKYLLIIQLLTCFQSEVFSSKDTNFGVLQVISGGSRLSLCASYVTPHARLPESEDKAILYPMIDLTNLNTCDVHNSSLNWRNLLSNVSIVAFTMSNCSLVDTAAIVQKYGGQGVIVVAPSLTTKLPSVYEMRNGDDNVSIPSGLISTNGFRQIKALGGAIFIKEYVPEDSFYMDFSFLIIWLLTLITVTLGTCWDTCILLPLNRDSIQSYGISDPPPNSKNQNSQHFPTPDGRREHIPLSQNSAVGKEKLQDKVQDEAAVLSVDEANRRLGFSILKIVIVLIIMSSFIILLYFFYDYAVYAVMALFILISVPGMFWCLSTFKFLIPFGYSLHCGKVNVEVRQIFILLLCFGFITAWLVLRKESYAWIFQDILVVFAAMKCISKLDMYNFKVCLVTVLLFFVYTTFLVYATPQMTPDSTSVMMAFAAGGVKADGSFKEHVPMSLRIPSASLDPLAVCVHRDAFIGLLDIIVPGVVVAYGFKFGEKMGKIPCLIYFFGALIALGSGIIFAFVAMYATNHPQPTLLYVAPCVLMTVVLISLARKEFKRFWEGEFKVNSNQAVYNAVSKNETRC